MNDGERYLNLRVGENEYNMGKRDNGKWEMEVEEWWDVPTRCLFFGSKPKMGQLY